jgi:hypothetical protein
MCWDMTKLGTKNYSFRINNRNTDKENQEWQIAESFWNGIMKLHLSCQGTNMHGTDTDFLEIGELKISVSVLYIKSDMTNNNRYHLSTHEIMKKVIEKFRPALEKEHAEILMENNRVEAEKLLNQNLKIKERMLALPDDKISGEAPQQEKGNSEETSQQSQKKIEELQEKIAELQAMLS